MRYHRQLAAALIAASLSFPAQATVLNDFNGGTLIADFQFDDAVGTAIQNAVNSADAIRNFDTDPDLAGVTTNGLGALDASGKSNNEFGSTYVDVDTLTTGRVIGLLDLVFDFSADTLDREENEEIRFSFISGDPRSTAVTVEMQFRREDDNIVSLLGNALGTGATDTPLTSFALSQSVLAMLDLDLDNASYELFFSLDGGASFTSAGTGKTDPSRGVESLRLTLNNDFSDDTALVKRFAAAYIAGGTPPVVPVPPMLGPFAIACDCLRLLGDAVSADLTSGGGDGRATPGVEFRASRSGSSRSAAGRHAGSFRGGTGCRSSCPGL